jgi:general secretion pathway protein N|tara:strand:- start:29493 stop:30236 length:744 start_codon:yes stop_codon:yes gene_type:complete
MKKTFAYIATFFVLYSVFVIALMPASWLMAQIKLPANVSITPVEGTIWHASVKQVMVDGVVINQVKSHLSLVSVLMLDPKLDVTFGDPLINGPEGQLTISGLRSDITIKDARVSLAANTVAARLNLPIDIIAHEQLTLNVSHFVMGAPICGELQGDVAWRSAAVSAFDEKVKLGNLSAALSCEKGELIAEIAPNNDLGLSYRAQLKQGGRFAGNGYLTPGEKFPEQLREVLSFLGKPDRKGRYRLKI